MSDKWNGIAEPDDIESYDTDAAGRAADTYRDRLVSVYCVAEGGLTDEQVRAEMSRLMGFQLTRKQALA